ncbi:hypothetical protein EDD37DRAFT_511618 [Exophiala viscosa]|uniref:Uncharacterized protein n=1 Tax=Exophiala viscosa TaxID=2486360 RepID=A0AAN6E1A6_9EURO|nr:hypothetical protein EDD36DRAFT_416744 [Exophiala viscosa]KAI1622230.1 hypothetical protein EDD37DRAFT_511618 [Exophiala viscosa]
MKDHILFLQYFCIAFLSLSRRKAFTTTRKRWMRQGVWTSIRATSIVSKKSGSIRGRHASIFELIGTASGSKSVQFVPAETMLEEAELDQASHAEVERSLTIRTALWDELLAHKHYQKPSQGKNYEQCQRPEAQTSKSGASSQTAKAVVIDIDILQSRGSGPEMLRGKAGMKPLKNSVIPNADDIFLSRFGSIRCTKCKTLLPKRISYRGFQLQARKQICLRWFDS